MHRLLTSCLLATVALTGWADPFAPSDPAERTSAEAGDGVYRLAGLISGTGRQKHRILVVHRRGEDERWWLLKLGESVPERGWQFVGIAAQMGLFVRSIEQREHYLELSVGGEFLP